MIPKVPMSVIPPSLLLFSRYPVLLGKETRKEECGLCVETGLIISSMYSVQKISIIQRNVFLINLIHNIRTPYNKGKTCGPSTYRTYCKRSFGSEVRHLELK